MRSSGVAKLPVGELLRVVLDLVEQYRDEIDDAMNLRMAFQVRRHVDVVLHGMQVHPGQDELAACRAVSADFCSSAGRAVVPIVRLVHVPEEDEIELFHDQGRHRGLRLSFKISSAASILRPPAQGRGAKAGFRKALPCAAAAGRLCKAGRGTGVGGLDDLGKCHDRKFDHGIYLM
jgi:hypothetical protein